MYGFSALSIEWKKLIGYIPFVYRGFDTIVYCGVSLPDPVNPTPSAYASLRLENCHQLADWIETFWKANKGNDRGWQPYRTIPMLPWVHRFPSSPSASVFLSTSSITANTHFHLKPNFILP